MNIRPPGIAPGTVLGHKIKITQMRPYIFSYKKGVSLLKPSQKSRFMDLAFWDIALFCKVKTHQSFRILI